jgi:hypothetical protein
LKDADYRVFTRMLRGKNLTLWPWKSIGFQIFLRTKYVPSLVKIHWRMLILVVTRMDGSITISLRNFVGEGIIKQQWTIEEISIFSNNSHLEWRAGLSRHKFERGPPNQIWFNLVQRFQKRRFKCDLISKYGLICIIGINRLKEKFHRKTWNIC